MKAEIILKLTELLQKEDFNAINAEVNEQIKTYKSLISEEKLKEKPVEEESTEVEQTEEELALILDNRKMETRIEELIVTFKDRRKAVLKGIAQKVMLALG